MAKVLKGKEVADKIKAGMKLSIEELKKEGRTPLLAIVRLGNNAGDVSYEKSIVKACEAAGIKSRVIERETTMTTEKLEGLMQELNADSEVSGILLFRPLPKHIDEERIRTSVSPDKDVDCMHPLNLERIFEGRMDGFSPCTPKAAVEILVHNQVPLEGRNVVVVNRSMVVGKPLVMMLLEKNATVTICHSRTKNLKELCSKADVVVTALGKAKFFTEDFFNDDSIVIDVGVSMSEDGKLSGDVDYDSVAEKVSMITPVPGGVGSVTTTILLNQVVLAELKKK
ncbi:bifunctional 5,10-methylenetetrahydrofolate dehydrogenase/5,10-methenyltetrahydrofolate cyclohydrolase [Gudongella oleilytica]|jgi:methylenetetrahydrofolate dehydrogenase (NADP+)/methenyltetrahydrofolate cyclohydrolase|uniref:bifunctional 5,10-methylenetetrahydrofolate dehydrogenase/5,10-methenyltetrahydrofolate cyclohydrolase n=1 Tax=Gudongella oleilytica TaxID=1582259 RepID=UPI002A36EEF5|nr:bifunctional 5,10-methylenetetrahydrofolate dehydrogenase/5,10-methenyltetrahydrofolate cyclohydrolase [Gudongella oleilytica]MDY0255645.1 bifunctional 5,10-methylenetetrahydrofolate dehydrogenase/5,10-methenyltetrahydrofolate cyclohydrolase [Gudongella oleilytica]